MSFQQAEVPEDSDDDDPDEVFGFITMLNLTERKVTWSTIKQACKKRRHCCRDCMSLWAMSLFLWFYKGIDKVKAVFLPQDSCFCLDQLFVERCRKMMFALLSYILLYINHGTQPCLVNRTCSV